MFVMGYFLLCLSISLLLFDRGHGEDLVIPTRIMQDTWVGVAVSVPTNDAKTYILKLFNSGPAVFDSIIEFRAELKDSTGHSADIKLFRYEWINNASTRHSIDRTFANFNSNIFKTFHKSKNVKSGIHSMAVAVYHKEKKFINIPIASGEMFFKLTDSINAHMLVKQNLSFQRETDVYSTDEVIHTCVNVTDMFRNRTEFEYTWLAGEHVTVTDTPCYDFRHTMVGTINITAWVKAKIPKYDGTMNYATEKEGHFAKTIILKEPLSAINITGEKQIIVGKTVHLNVTMVGSTPTSICWNVTFIEAVSTLAPLDDEVGNDTCSPTYFVNTNWHLISVNLSEVGSYNFTINVSNDVSQTEIGYQVGIIFPPAPENELPIVLVVTVFGCLLIVVMIVGAVFITNLGKKRHVEIANFDFHPSLSLDDADKVSFRMVNKRIKRLLIDIKGTFQRSSSNQARFAPTTAVRYGSIRDELYESL